MKNSENFNERTVEDFILSIPRVQAQECYVLNLDYSVRTFRHENLGH